MSDSIKIATIEALKEKIKAQSFGSGTNEMTRQVGEQLEEIALESESNAELVLNDLDNPEMSIEAAEKLIKEYAKSHGGCCSGKSADKILRDLYGLPPKDSKQQASAEPGIISLESFMRGAADGI